MCICFCVFKEREREKGKRVSVVKPIKGKMSLLLSLCIQQKWIYSLFIDHFTHAISMPTKNENLLSLSNFTILSLNISLNNLTLDRISVILY